MHISSEWIKYPSVKEETYSITTVINSYVHGFLIQKESNNASSKCFKTTCQEY